MDKKSRIFKEAANLVEAEEAIEAVEKSDDLETRLRANAARYVIAKKGKLSLDEARLAAASEDHELAELERELAREQGSRPQEQPRAVSKGLRTAAYAEIERLAEERIHKSGGSKGNAILLIAAEQPDLYRAHREQVLRGEYLADEAEEGQPGARPFDDQYIARCDAMLKSLAEHRVEVEKHWPLPPTPAPHRVATGEIIAKSAPQRLITGVVFAPNEVDLQGDQTSAEELEKACYDFNEKYSSGRAFARLDHDAALSRQQATIVESFVSKADSQVNGQFVPAGTWLQTWRLSPELWAKVEKGEYTGFSMGGYGKRTPAPIAKSEPDPVPAKPAVVGPPPAVIINMISNPADMVASKDKDGTMHLRRAPNSYDVQVVQ